MNKPIIEYLDKYYHLRFHEKWKSFVNSTGIRSNRSYRENNEIMYFLLFIIEITSSHYKPLTTVCLAIMNAYW